MTTQSPDASSSRRGTIGVFDSGIGGLTILEHLVRSLPDYDFDYFGDVGRAPYGSRSRPTIAHFTEQAVNFLFDQGAVLIIIACNTATAVSIHYLQTKYLRTPGVTDRKILGIVVPTAEEAAARSRSKHIGVLGTEATVSSKTVEVELKKVDPALIVQSVACPLLVPLVEEGWENTDVAHLACREYVNRLTDPEIDTVILACTHYPFLRHALEATLPPGTLILEQGPFVATRTVDYLRRHPEIESQLGQHGRTKFFTSDDPHQFMQVGQKYLHGPIRDVARVTEVARPRGEQHRALRVVDDDEFELAVPFGKEQQRKTLSDSC